MGSESAATAVGAALFANLAVEVSCAQGLREKKAPERPGACTAEPEARRRNSSFDPERKRTL